MELPQVVYVVALEPTGEERDIEGCPLQRIENGYAEYAPNHTGYVVRIPIGK